VLDARAADAVKVTEKMSQHRRLLQKNSRHAGATDLTKVRSKQVHSGL
jgi:hypothetical protein